MAVATTLAITAAVGGITSMVGAQVKKNEAKKQMEAEAKKANDAKTALEEIEKNRQEVINPYESVTDLSGMISDTSNLLSNPYASLGVSTAAAEVQAEEADIALANTLDLLASTGASAGGATALAQAALSSKRGISTSIQQQEAANAQLRAQGESNLQAMKQAEAIRVQGAKLGEAKRQQEVDVAGKEFVFGQQEQRETAALNRTAAQLQGAKQRQVQADSDKVGVLGARASSIGNITGSVIGAIGAGGGG